MKVEEEIKENIVKTEDDFKPSSIQIPLDFLQHKLYLLELNSPHLNKFPKDKIKSKSLDIEQFIVQIHQKYLKNPDDLSLTMDEIGKIKEFATSMGGFIKMDYRRELYKMLLCVNESRIKENFETVWINKETTEIEYQYEQLFQSKIYSFTNYFRILFKRNGGDRQRCCKKYIEFFLSNRK